ncbi:hypothetical protein F4823DRAFT_361757 [Ustulina deusta]|nr:hypothetical protein F4823DRAFT_361757 [Ustulina deusta]
MAPVKGLQLSVICDLEEDGKFAGDLDLVLVHGFTGDLIGTWTYREDGRKFFWPRELLLLKQL